MRHPLFYLVLLFVLPSFASAQAFTDTIFTYRPDTIVCHVDHLDSLNVYYKFFEEVTKDELYTMDRLEVSSISKDSLRYFDLTEIPQNDTTDEELEHFAETNGIIHPAHLDSPPLFQGGEVDFLRYMQNNVRNQSEHATIFGNSFVKVLYEVTIDDMGQVENVQISQSSVSTSNISEDANEVENQIKDVIAQMPSWAPAVMNGENIAVDVYIPIKFRIEQNAIIMYSGKNAFVFGNMK